MKIKIPFAVIFSDLILPYIARNIKTITITLCVIFLGIFTTLYFINKYNQKNEVILGKYLSAVNDVSENNNSLALKKFETVYNSSNGMLEVMSLIQIIDITIHEKQYKLLPKLLKEILSLNINPTQSLILYSKALLILDIIKEKNVLSPERQTQLTLELVNKIKKLKVSKGLIPNKNMLLIGLGETITQTAPEVQNELSSTIELIQ